ncbi:MAG: hypothetical protein ACXV7J_03060 [Methylomonas sp.]
MPMDAEVAKALRLVLNTDGPVVYGPGNQHPSPREASEQFFI